MTPPAQPPRRATPSGGGPGAGASTGAGGSGALYVHLQSENGVDHRTIVLSPRMAQLLRAVMSRYGIALAVAVAGSWLYFAGSAARIPAMRDHIAELESEAQRIDELQRQLQALQAQYDQVQQMLGVPPIGATGPDSSATSQQRRDQETSDGNLRKGR